MQEPILLQPEEKEFKTFYKRSLLLIKWRPRLKKIGIALLIIIDLLLVGKTVYSFLDYGAINYFKERAMIGSIVDGLDHFHLISKARAATSLKASTVQVFALDDERTDFYAELSNPNEDWEASFSYYFSYGDSVSDTMDGFILPSENAKPLTALAVKTGNAPKTASLTVTDLVWTRVNHHAISDYPSWAADRLTFEFADVSYDSKVEIDGATIGRSTFTVKDTGAYGFWEPQFVIVLYRNDKVVGVTSATAPRLAAGEARTISVNWFGTPPQANATKIFPNIDIFDPTVYMPLRGELQPDVRERIKIKK